MAGKSPIRTALLLAALAAPAVTAAAWAVHRWAKLGDSPAYLAGAAGSLCALVGLPLLVIMAVLGARVRLVERHFGLDRMIRFHILLGPVVVGLFLAHALLRTAKVSLLSEQSAWQWSFLFSFSLGQADAGALGLAVGRAALAALILGAVFAKAGRLILPFHLWKPAHALMYAVAGGGLVHSRLVGDDIPLFPYNIVWLAGAAVLAAAAGSRIAHVASRTRTSTWNLDAVVQENRDIGTLWLSRPEGAGSLAGRAPGQFAVIRTKQRLGWTEPRPFTISCAPASPRLCFTVKRSGRITSGLLALRPGTGILVEGPYGVFTPVFEREKSIVMIAGGVGVTPFLSIIRHVRSAALDTDLTLIWVNRTREGIIASGEIEEEARTGRLRVIHVLTREQGPAPGKAAEPGQDRNPVSFEFGHLNAGILKRHVGRAGTTFYLCGPPAMQGAVLAELKRAFGVKAGDVKRELFFW